MNTYKPGPQARNPNPSPRKVLDKDLSPYVIPTLVIQVSRDANREMP